MTIQNIWRYIAQIASLQTTDEKSEPIRYYPSIKYAIQGLDVDNASYYKRYDCQPYSSINRFNVWVLINGITLESEQVDRNPYMSESLKYNWLITLRIGKRSMKTYFSMNQTKDPDLYSVMGCLQSDVSLLESCPTIESMSQDLGCVITKRSFNGMVRNAEKFKFLLGDLWSEVESMEF